ncbi:MAG: signal recognition particle-docking protein FtsY, partial [Pseudomonadota bacterium]
PAAAPDPAPTRVPGPDPDASPDPAASNEADEAPEITPPTAPPTASREPAPKRSWLSRLTSGLSKTSGALTDGIGALFTKKKLDAATLEELEDLLIQADLGVDTAMSVTEALAADKVDKEVSPDEVRALLAEKVTAILEPVAQPLTIDPARTPHVILVVGVNGAGKTTTIGKLAQQFARDGKSVMLAAGDTFRAAAIEQLKIWGERTGAPVMARDTGADAAGLGFDALTHARAQGTDVLMMDTAGRLQNKSDLMEELAKIIRVMRKVDETAPHSVLLVLDATTGQNALRQVEVFKQMCGVTGLVMTKLDGTARGGILVAISNAHGLPIHAIGVGESVEDLRPFAADEFARAIVGQVGTPAT